MSCLPTDALSHFEQREQELLALDQALEAKRANAIAEASNAMRDADAAATSSQQSRPQSASQLPPAMPSPLSDLAGGIRPGTGSTAAATAPASGSTNASDAVAAIVGATAAADPENATSGQLHTTMRFQKARILALQEELDRTIKELTGKESETGQLRADLKQTTDENRKLQKALQSAEQGRDKAKEQLASCESREQELKKGHGDLLKEKDQLEVLRRKHEQESKSNEVRLNRLQEELEKLKNSSKEKNNEDKDRSAFDRKEVERLTVEVRKLERQRSELVGAFKKQMKLIDVLKRQRAHIEAAHVLSFTEDEFIRVLELGEKLGE